MTKHGKSEKDLYQIFFAIDCGNRSKNGKVSLSAVIERLQSKFTVTVNNELEQIAIEKCFDCFMRTKKREYTMKRLKVDYDEILRGASFEIY